MGTPSSTSLKGARSKGFCFNDNSMTPSGPSTKDSLPCSTPLTVTLSPFWLSWVASGLLASLFSRNALPRALTIILAPSTSTALPSTSRSSMIFALSVPGTTFQASMSRFSNVKKYSASSSSFHVRMVPHRASIPGMPNAKSHWSALS